MFKYKVATRTCPQCSFKWVEDLSQWVQSLQKVDFFWINRDQKSFEWFLKLLGQMEAEQASDEAGNHKFLDIHMYLTAALQRTDMRAVALQTAIEILHKRVLL